MHFMSFHVDGREGPGGAEVLAGTAADAVEIVDSRYHDAAFMTHHGNGAYRADRGAVAASVAVGQRDAVLLDPDGMTDLDGRFFGPADGADGSGGTDFLTSGAFRTAIALFIRGNGLHEMLQVGRGTKHMVGAGRDTELTACAVLAQVTYAESSRRNNRSLPFGSLFVLYSSQSAVDGLGLGFKGGSPGQGGSQSQELTAVHAFFA